MDAIYGRESRRSPTESGDYQMSKYRPECVNSCNEAIPYDTALFLIRDSVAKRRSLIHGALHRGRGYCAIGAFWYDNPGVTLTSSLIDEVAAVNDSVPPSASARDRWKKVNEWLHWKVKTLAGH